MAYAQVILPVRLSWQPWYRVPEGTCPGQGVKVHFAGREMKGIVYKMQQEAPGDIAPEKIHPVEEVLNEVPSAGGASLRFWEQTAGYYLCTLGEVFKACFRCCCQEVLSHCCCAVFALREALYYRPYIRQSLR